MRLVSVVFGENTIGNGHMSKDKKLYLKKSIFTMGVIECVKPASLEMFKIQTKS